MKIPCFLSGGETGATMAHGIEKTSEIFGEKISQFSGTPGQIGAKYQAEFS